MRAIEEVLEFAEKLVYSQTGEHLNDIQRIILLESWQAAKKTYDQIAEEYGYSANYIKQGVAPKLWRLLSEVIGEKVSKANLHSVLERQISHDQNSLMKELTIDRIAEKVRQKLEPDQSASILPTDPKQTGPTSQTPSAEDLLELELPDGSVPLNSTFYVERVPQEQRCYEEILKPGALIQLKAPRQMGKTSLMNRILARAGTGNYKTALLDFQEAEESVLTDLEKLLRWFCANLTRQLELEPKLNDYWDQDLGSKMSCTFYLEAYLLQQIPSPIVLALEEVNQLFKHLKIAQEFFSLVRSWHEKGKNQPIWQKLRLLLVQCTEIYIPLNINQSPFNLGLAIELKPFTPEQLRDLTQRHGLPQEQEIISQLMQLLAGHPYLVRLSLHHLARQTIPLKELVSTAATDTGIYRDHLHRHLWNLQQNPDLATAFQRVLKAAATVELEQVQGFKLHSMGLVNLQGNRVTVSCDLYRRYFRDRLKN